LSFSTDLARLYLRASEHGRKRGGVLRDLALPLAALCAACLLVAAQAYLLTAQRIAPDLGVGSREADQVFDGVYNLETDTRGMFRWSNGHSQFHFEQVAHGDALVLVMGLGPPPQALIGASVELAFSDRAFATISADARPRRYQVLVPQDALRGGNLTVDLRSPTVAVAPDVRQVSMRIERADIHALGKHLIWPGAGRVFLQTGLLALAALLLARLHVGPDWVIALLALIALGLLAAFQTQYLLFATYVGRLAAALALLLALTLWVLPLLERTAAWAGPPRVLRALWGVALMACVLRLIGSLYPLFSAYDLKLNVDRLLSTLAGTLVMTNQSFEFRGGVTVYPPGPYLVLLPGLLLGLAPGVLVQGGIALLDGLSVLATGLLASRLGLSARAALIAALVAAVAPIGLTSLYYGHTAQIFGQALMAPLALTLLIAFERPRPRYWYVAGTLLSIALLTHIGVTILAIAWLAMLWLALGLRRALAPAAWRSLSLMLILAGVIGAVFAYAPVAAMKIAELRTVGTMVFYDDTRPAYTLIARAFWISFHPLGIILTLPGLLLLRRLPRGGAALVGCWIVAVALFWAVEMLSGLQVRYLVFLAPMVAIAVGLLLDRLAKQSGAGRLAVCAVLGLLLVQSCALWYAGAFANVAPSMVPLLR
jgi:hypothetical protein